MALNLEIWKPNDIFNEKGGNEGKMREVTCIDLSKYPDIKCPFCEQKGKFGVMKAKIVCSCIGERVSYHCTDGCVYCIRPEEVRTEWKLDSLIVFER